MLRQDLITTALAARGTNIADVIAYDITDSTNTRAKEYAVSHPDIQNPVLFVADSQSGGRGRMGKSFHSARGAGIYMSLLIKPCDTGNIPTRLTAFAAVVLARAIERITGLQADIKWVNDIYSKGKKLAGILAEGVMTQDGKIPYFVLGMGINVYKTAYPDDISDIATSIEESSGVRALREELIAEIVSQLITGLDDIDSDEVYREYIRRDIVSGRDITVINGNESYPARALGITRDFSLLVERPDGSRSTLFSGEISTKINTRINKEN